MVDKKILSSKNDDDETKEVEDVEEDVDDDEVSEEERIITDINQKLEDIEGLSSISCFVICKKLMESYWDEVCDEELVLDYNDGFIEDNLEEDNDDEVIIEVEDEDLEIQEDLDNKNEERPK